MALESYEFFVRKDRLESYEITENQRLKSNNLRIVAHCGRDSQA